jgi:hypothetical protein
VTQGLMRSSLRSLAAMTSASRLVL